MSRATPPARRRAKWLRSGDYTRGISISYDNNGTMMEWEKNKTFRAIVLGSLTTGNQFVTQAPDQVMMILRDPPGSGSSATYTQGSTRKVKGYLKVSIKTKVGASVDVDFEAKSTYSTDNSWTHEITTKHDISTSDAKAYVGPDGDIFIGASKNMLFGTCHRLRLKKDESISTPKYDLIVEDARAA